jgi:glyoxylase-like metal-dependent hydrolase (beta-lactamase superfamily II)
VIISHFHGDHINGLVTADNKPAFPNAEVLVPAGEWKFWHDAGEESKAAGNVQPRTTLRTSGEFCAWRQGDAIRGRQGVVPGITDSDVATRPVSHISSGNAVSWCRRM